MERFIAFLIVLGAAIGLGQPGIRGALYEFILWLIKLLQWMIGRGG
jgi:hypothetical protein